MVLQMANGQKRKKSQVLHIRNYQKPRSVKSLKCCNQELVYTQNYKYLGFIVHEHLSEKPTVEALTGAATRSYGRIVNMFRKLCNMGIGTYESLYSSYVAIVMKFASAVWGYNDFSSPQVLQNRIQHYFLGV